MEPTTPWIRLAAGLLDTALLVKLLVVGWIVWTIALRGTGQTPGRRLLGLHARRPDGSPAGARRLLLRDGLVRPLVALPALLSIVGLVPLALAWRRPRIRAWWERRTGVATG